MKKMGMVEPQRCYVVSGPGCFFFRFCNSAFGSKWCGLWSGDTKLVDYYAVRLGDGKAYDWLSDMNCRWFSQEGGEAVHEYSLSIPAQVSESVRAEGGTLVVEFRITPKKSFELDALLELGFNIRKSWENLHTRQYSVETSEKKLTVNDGLASCTLESSLPLTLLGKETKEHNPGGYVNQLGWSRFNEEPQRTMVCRILVKAPLKEGVEEKVTLRLSMDGASQERIPVPQNAFSAEGWEKFITESGVQMGNFIGVNQKGEAGLYAGHPYFLTFWGRDSCLCLPSYTLLGMGDFTKRALLALANNQKGGVIPNGIDSGVDNCSSDSTPLWVLALAHYFDHNRDEAFFSQMRGNLEQALEVFVRQDVDGDGLVEADHGSAMEPIPHFTTWMDSVERSGKPLEVQFLWLEALERGADILDGFGWEGKKWRDVAGRLRDKIELFWENGFYCDRLDRDGQRRGRSANPLFGLCFSQVEKERALLALKTLEDEFTRPWGVLSWSPGDREFEPDGYHKGMAWGLLTGMMAFAEGRFGRSEEALKYLQIMRRNTGRRCVGGIDEVYDSQGAPQGAVNQAWSICLAPRIFSEILMGARPKALENRVILEPNMPSSIGRAFSEVPFNAKVLRFSFERPEGRSRLSVSGLGQSDLLFVPPEGTEKIWVNGKEAPTGRLTLRGFDSLQVEWA